MLVSRLSVCIFISVMLVQLATCAPNAYLAMARGLRLRDRVSLARSCRAARAFARVNFTEYWSAAIHKLNLGTHYTATHLKHLLAKCIQARCYVKTPVLDVDANVSWDCFDMFYVIYSTTMVFRRVHRLCLTLASPFADFRWVPQALSHFECLESVVMRFSNSEFHDDVEIGDWNAVPHLRCLSLWCVNTEAPGGDAVGSLTPSLTRLTVGSSVPEYTMTIDSDLLGQGTFTCVHLRSLAFTSVH